MVITKTVTRDRGKDSERTAEYTYPSVAVREFIPGSKRAYVAPEGWTTEEEATQALNTISAGKQMIIARLVDHAIADLARQKAWEALGAGAEVEKMVTAFELSAKNAYEGFLLGIKGTDITAPEYETFRAKWLEKPAFDLVREHFSEVAGIVKRDYTTADAIAELLPSFRPPETK